MASLAPSAPPARPAAAAAAHPRLSRTHALIAAVLVAVAALGALGAGATWPHLRPRSSAAEGGLLIAAGLALAAIRWLVFGGERAALPFGGLRRLLQPRRAARRAQRKQE